MHPALVRVRLYVITDVPSRGVPEAVEGTGRELVARVAKPTLVLLVLRAIAAQHSVTGNGELERNFKLREYLHRLCVAGVHHSQCPPARGAHELQEALVLIPPVELRGRRGRGRIGWIGGMLAVE